jgi:alcohol dehydrogenase (cytochrome c)
VVIENHVIVGSGNDLDSPGFLQSFDPETGALQWKFYTVPMNPGDPGLESWKNLDAARNGGGHPWLPGAYDPEQRLYIFGTGNPTPAYISAPRGDGDNLFTVRDRRGQCRHRQDGVVLPDLSARDARLGLGADAGPR